MESKRRGLGSSGARGLGSSQVGTRGSARGPSERPEGSPAKDTPTRTRARWGPRKPGPRASASGGAASAKAPASLAEAKRRRRAPRALRKADIQPVLTHVTETGHARMVDVSDKPVTAREAIARGHITMSPDALRAVRDVSLKKGDALQAARLAGIMAAKRTAELIPLCHPLPLSHVEVILTAVRNGYDIEGRVRTTAQTGVEMEALTAVSVAALTIYDMVKAIDKGMIIGEIRLVAKRGGRSGDYTA